MINRWMGVLILSLLLLTGCGDSKSDAINLQASSDKYTATLVISPGIVGPNTYTVSIVDEAGEAQTSGEATLHFDMNMSHGKSDQPLELATDGVWTGDGPHLMMPGKWMLTLEWQDENGNNESFEYNFTLKE